MQMNQRFAADCLTKPISCALNGPSGRSADLCYRRRLSQRPPGQYEYQYTDDEIPGAAPTAGASAFDDGKEQVIAIDGIFARRQGVGILLRNGL
jgi:hypothetical protein